MHSRRQAVVMLAGCAKDASQVGATYVSPITYQTYTCPQLTEEAQRVAARAAEAAGVQDQKSTNDKVAMGVGLITFWPALLFTKGNDENTAYNRGIGSFGPCTATSQPTRRLLLIDFALGWPACGSAHTSIANLPFQCKPKSFFKSESYRDFYSTNKSDKSGL